MILDHHLAQQIVDRTMAIIGNNINVINQAGTIIASGDKTRIGQLHDGALLALKRNDSVEVTTDAIQSLQGSKHGINLLLKNSGQVIGVVGITGEPDTIRSYAELVKLTAEMIIEQALLTEKLQWDRRHKEDFISAWIHNDQSKEKLENEASLLGIDLTLPRLTLIVKLTKPNQPTNHNIRQVVELLEKHDDSHLIAILSRDEVLVLKRWQKKPVNTIDGQESLINQLVANFERNGIVNIKVSLGKSFDCSNDMNLSYLSAKQVMAFGERHFPEQKVYLFNNFKTVMLLSPLSGSWQEQQLLTTYNKLVEYDHSGQLINTLHALFVHYGNMQTCADSLSIHRNTLRYRLNKIEDLTGISVHHFSGLVELYLASQLSKLK